MISSVNVALPDIQNGFLDQGINAVLLSWIATTYLLAAGVSLVPMGRLADIKGRKKILGFGFGLFSFSSLCCFFSPDVYWLLFFRGLQGFGGGMIFGTGMAILTSVFPPQNRGRVIGLAVSAVYIGLSTGPFAGGLLTHYFGWRSLFLVIFFFSLLPLLVLIVSLKGEWADAAGEHYDLTGAVIYIPSLVGIIYGFSILPQLPGIILLLGGVIGLTAFVIRQKNLAEPLLQVESVHQQPAVCALQCSRPHSLQCNLRADVSAEPLPSVYSRSGQQDGGRRAYCPTPHDGAFFSVCRSGIRQDRAPHYLIYRHGDNCGRAFLSSLLSAAGRVLPQLFSCSCCSDLVLPCFLRRI